MTKGSKILIVEDEMVISLEISATLKRLGYEVVGQAITGEEAVRLAETADPDLVLMDIRLRGEMDGIEAACQIKDSFDLPVIFLTAHSDEATLERAIAISPSGYLIKPFKDRELYSSIELGLHKHEIRQRIRPDRTVCLASASPFMETPGIGMVSISPRGIIVRANATCFALFGATQAEICGTRITGWITAAPGSSGSSSSGDQLIPPESAVLRKQNGEMVPVKIHLGFLLGEGSGVQGYLLAIHPES